MLVQDSWEDAAEEEYEKKDQPGMVSLLLHSQLQVLVLLVLLNLLTAISIVSSITQGLPNLLTAISNSIVSSITQGLHSL